MAGIKIDKKAIESLKFRDIEIPIKIKFRHIFPELHNYEVINSSKKRLINTTNFFGEYVSDNEKYYFESNNGVVKGFKETVDGVFSEFTKNISEERIEDISERG